MYEKYICPRIKTVEFYVRTGTKHTELSWVPLSLSQNSLKPTYSNPPLSFATPKRNSYIRHWHLATYSKQCCRCIFNKTLIKKSHCQMTKKHQKPSNYKMSRLW